jgi:hypothetical protein
MKPLTVQSHSTASASNNLNNTLGHYSSSSESEEEEVEYEPLPVQDQDSTVPISPEEQAPSASQTPGITEAALLDRQKKQPRKKKGKVFASKDSMLALIEKVNLDQDEKIKEKVDRDLEYMKRQAAVNEASKNRKAKKEQRLTKIKENLRKGGVRVKGENKRTLKSLRQEKANGAAPKKAFQRPGKKGEKGSEKGGEKRGEKKGGKRVKFAE